jgi:N-acetylmuramoyl-L-alanine amidase
MRFVTAVRHWSLTDTTRVAVEISGDFQFRTDRAHNPERVFFDILNCEPKVAPRRWYTETLEDHLAKRIRVAEYAPGITRVVIELADGTEVTTSQLANPNRLIVELHAAAGTGPGGTRPTPGIPKTPPPGLPLNPPPAITPTIPGTPREAPIKADATDTVTAEPNRAQLENSGTAAGPTLTAKPATERPVNEKPAVPVESSIPATGKAARKTTSGQTSLVRALGLKVQRVVIDPGHGGHDQGTEGSHGLLEKELVLDVAQRVGKLIEDQMGAEVIYTRSDDTFIPLEGRTALANEKKADLFLSIHANSSPVARISGVETYYLNFADTKDAMEVAARENASSQESIFELRDSLEKISAHDKAEESRDFAGRVQSALFALSTRNFPAQKNRGVKRAPFRVLIGAKMPSVLAEIGFLSNPREEALLKKPDYRQKLAEALYRGVSRYADSLSHFQMAQNQ